MTRAVNEGTVQRSMNTRWYRNGRALGVGVGIAVGVGLDPDDDPEEEEAEGACLMDVKLAGKLFTLAVALGVGLTLAGCGRRDAQSREDAHRGGGHESGHAHGQRGNGSGHHAAPHGGSLNVIESCELAHVEVKVEGSVMTCWFVGGGQDTGRSVRVPDEQITLSVVTVDNTRRTLVLLAEPIELAEERVGDCSCFEGEADWLPAAKRFEASGTVTMKGKARELKIHYPGGHDPNHEHGHGDGNGHHDASD